jgi:hypothetical protein
MFNLQPGTCDAISVQQLNVEIISSQIMYDDILSPVAPTHTGRKGYKGSTVVTRTEIDPVTGQVKESQTMRLPVLPDYLPELLPDLPMGQDSTPQPGPAPGTSAGDTATTEDQQAQQSAPQCIDSCGLPNTASSACVEGMCRVTACAPGWEDCDGNPLNGCEANVLAFFSDDNHCGSCNKVCLSPLTCQLGKCSVRSPEPTPSQGDIDTPADTTPPPEDQQQQQQAQTQKPSEQPAQGGEAPGDQTGEGVQPTPAEPAEQQPEQQKPKPQVCFC